LVDTLRFGQEVFVMGGKTRPPYPAEYRARIMELARAGRNPGGHLKFPHLWPGQNPPPERRQDGCILALGGLSDNPRGGFFESPAFSLELEQVAVVHQAIKQWGHNDDVPEQLRPVLDHAV